MLNIFIGAMKEDFEGTDFTYIDKPSAYFDAVYENDYLSSDLARKIVNGIDLTDYIGDEVYKSPVFGMISPKDLSSGCKGVLLLLAEDNIVVAGQRFGDNCLDWILEVAKVKDIYITLNHVMDFKEPFEFKDVYQGDIISNKDAYVNRLVDYNTGRCCKHD